MGSEGGGVESGGVSVSCCQSFVVLSGFHDWSVSKCNGEGESR